MRDVRWRMGGVRYTQGDQFTYTAFETLGMWDWEAEEGESDEEAPA